jgi:hypothetical protein
VERRQPEHPGLIYDCIQNKVSGPTWTNAYCQYLTSGGAVVIPAQTFETDAIPFPYSLDAAPLPGSIRNGYYNLSHHYIAAVLNQANGACVPAGIQSLLNDATDFFSNNGTAAATCPLPSSCGLQKTWAATLET